jgi:hypothetical protein
MGFAFLVDIIQMRTIKQSTPVATHEHYMPGEEQRVKEGS